MAVLSKKAIKQVLGELPLTAELYWQLRQAGKPLNKSFSLHRTEKRLPEWCAQAKAARQNADGSQINGRRVMIFSTLRYWIEHATLLSLAMAGLGNTVTLAYLPYANWRKPINRFDLRRQNLYCANVLRQAATLIQPVSLLDVKSSDSLPFSLVEAIQNVSERDVQYTLQVEEVDRSGELYQLRLERNTQAACAALAWIQAQGPGHLPDVIITPNGSILENGIIYQVAHYLDIPVVTYEFGEQRQRIWLAHNAEVMRQETDILWEARKHQTLSESQWKQVRTLFASRQSADLWENFSRRWQGLPSQGGTEVRTDLGLDSRPIVLLAANVIGDSLTLGRQVFSQSMTEWIKRTVEYFIARDDVQLVVRIHPGERYTQGPSVAEVVRRALSDLQDASSPTHIHLVAANAQVNTYDLVEIADLGLVYTTTVGMEMAMSGVPSIVIGQTHYRGKGFTIDPTSWKSYFRLLDQTLSAPAEYRLTQEQVERAWSYAYRFFFEYPCPFPWHLLHFWDELENWTMERVLSEEGQAEFGNTFRYLAGEPRDWSL